LPWTFMFEVRFLPCECVVEHGPDEEGNCSGTKH
jgi:hypothetical protein